MKEKLLETFEKLKLAYSKYDHEQPQETHNPCRESGASLCDIVDELRRCMHSELRAGGTIQFIFRQGNLCSITAKQSWSLAITGRLVYVGADNYTRYFDLNEVDEIKVIKRGTGPHIERQIGPTILQGAELLLDTTLDIRLQAWTRTVGGRHKSKSLAKYQSDIYFLIQAARQRYGSPVILPQDDLVLSLIGYRTGYQIIDLDNFLKAILDAGQPNIWPDDKQIIGFKDSFIFHGAARDCIDIKIWRLDPKAVLRLLEVSRDDDNQNLH